MRVASTREDAGRLLLTLFDERYSRLKNTLAPRSLGIIPIASPSYLASRVSRYLFSSGPQHSRMLAADLWRRASQSVLLAAHIKAELSGPFEADRLFGPHLAELPLCDRYPDTYR